MDVTFRHACYYIYVNDVFGIWIDLVRFDMEFVLVTVWGLVFF